MTAHSTFLISITCNENSSSHIDVSIVDASRQKRDAFIIWDRVLMYIHHSIEAVEISLKDLMWNSIEFGGNAILILKEFWQRLPKVSRGLRVRKTASCIKKVPYFCFWRCSVFQKLWGCLPFNRTVMLIKKPQISKPFCWKSELGLLRKQKETVSSFRLLKTRNT